MRRLRCVVCCLGYLFVASTWTVHAQTDGLQLRSTNQLANPPSAATATSRVAATSLPPDALPTGSQRRVGLGGCVSNAADLPSQLTLSDVLEQVMCKSPTMRQALANVQGQQASVELAESAFLPRVSANIEVAGNRIPNSNITSVSSSAYASLSLGWVLFDFGSRNATLEQARQTLVAAIATQDNSNLTTLTDTLRIYADALSVWGRLDSLREAEAAANQSTAIAQARYDAQLGSLAEKLQAQTAFAQATLDRTRAQGLWQSARGTLAVVMGLPVQQAIGLTDVESAFPSLDEAPAVEVLLAQARAEHPRMRSARAEISALRARLDAVRADSKGVVTLAGGASAARALGSGSASTDRSLGGAVVATVPLFNGAEERARSAQVQSQISAREAQLQIIERELDTEVWRSAQQIRTESESLGAARQLLTSALASHQVAVGRYKAGVGTLQDLLTAQAALANARAQLHEAKLTNVQARIRLTLVSGRLGVAAKMVAPM